MAMTAEKRMQEEWEEPLQAEKPKPEGRPSMRRVLRSRNFRLLWVGEGISVLGDQFYFIALPWLVLQLTGDPLATGTVLAVAGIPRALFMLVGGALTDRFSPRTLMLLSNLFRFVLTGMLAATVMIGSINLWMLYAFALLFGLADAFFYPAQSSIIPRMVQKDDLQAGNSIIQGTAQISIFVGPALAGLLIALFGQSQVAGTTENAPDLQGIGLAFAFDALTFLASLATLALMRMRTIAADTGTSEQQGVLSSIHEGLVNVWNDGVLRAVFVLIAAMNLFVMGPFSVGIPVLADTRWAEGAAAFGIIVSVYGAGSLLGTVVAGALPKPGPHQLGKVLMLLSVLTGICVALLGIAPTTILAAAVSFIIGVSDGYVIIMFMTWLQARTAPSMLGRMMSLVMFAVIGLSPVSTAVAGALIDLNVTVVFIVGGCIMALISFAAILSKSVREMGVIAKQPAALASAMNED
jgi:MFS family permease